jgi:hypothetical protein
MEPVVVLFLRGFVVVWTDLAPTSSGKNAIWSASIIIDPPIPAAGKRALGLPPRRYVGRCSLISLPVSLLEPFRLRLLGRLPHAAFDLVDD